MGQLEPDPTRLTRLARWLPSCVSSGRAEPCGSLWFPASKRCVRDGESPARIRAARRGRAPIPALPQAGQVSVGRRARDGLLARVCFGGLSLRKTWPCVSSDLRRARGSKNLRFDGLCGVAQGR